MGIRSCSGRRLNRNFTTKGDQSVEVLELLEWILLGAYSHVIAAALGWGGHYGSTRHIESCDLMHRTLHSSVIHDALCYQLLGAQVQGFWTLASAHACTTYY